MPLTLKNTKKIFQGLNTSTYVILMLFLAFLMIKSIGFGYPWALSCYVCKKCTSACIYGIDSSQLLLAANLNDPELYISVTNVRLSAKDALAVDENMIVTYKSHQYRLSEAIKRDVIKPDDIVLTHKLRASDAAKFCIKCRACQKICPLELPIIEVINELAANK